MAAVKVLLLVFLFVVQLVLGDSLIQNDGQLRGLGASQGAPCPAPTLGTTPRYDIEDYVDMPSSELASSDEGEPETFVIS